MRTTYFKQTDKPDSNDFDLTRIQIFFILVHRKQKLKDDLNRDWIDELNDKVDCLMELLKPEENKIHL